MEIEAGIAATGSDQLPETRCHRGGSAAEVEDVVLIVNQLQPLKYLESASD
jgi:hypothetical protein